MSTHLFQQKTLIIAFLLSVTVASNLTCVSAKATSGSTFEGMVGKYSARLRSFCDKIKAANEAQRNGTPLPRPFKNCVILYGPPGNGKTTIARKIAQESGSKLIEICGAEVVQKFYGDGVKNIDRLFTEADDHVEKECGTAIIFIDEIDAVAKTDGESREEHLAATQKMWRELDRIKNDPRIGFVCVTNNFNKLNNTFLDRFGENKVEIKNPDEETRREVLNYYTRLRTGKVWSKNLLDKFARETKDLSIRAIEDLVAGSYAAAERNNGVITETIVKNVLSDIKKQAKEDEKSYWSYAGDFAWWGGKQALGGAIWALSTTGTVAAAVAAKGYFFAKNAAKVAENVVSVTSIH